MFITWILSLTLASVVLAQNVPYEPIATAMFNEFDANHSDDIDRSEIDHVFRQYDSNGDGRITRHEFTVYIDNHFPSLHDLHNALYDVHDSDGDHHLDLHDFDLFFNLMDGSGNGLVSRFEFVRYWSILITDLEHLHRP